MANLFPKEAVASKCTSYLHNPRILSERPWHTNLGGNMNKTNFHALGLALMWSPALIYAQSSFKIVPTPNGHHGARNNSLSAAASSSPSDIWAVGQTTIHFDGTQWTAFNAPLITGDNTSNLNGVVDISPTEAW